MPQGAFTPVMFKDRVFAPLVHLLCPSDNNDVSSNNPKYIKVSVLTSSAFFLSY